MIVLPAPGSTARQVRVPPSWPLWLAMLALVSVVTSVELVREVRAQHDEAVRRDESARALAACDKRQWRARMRERSPLFQALRPGLSDAEFEARTLRLYDVNSEQTLTVSPFLPDGQTSPGAFFMLREFMRCRRSGHTLDMHPDLVRLLMRISQHFDGAELQIVSAHRKPDGVVTSESSQHAKGTASDIRIEGVSVDALAAAARDVGARGIGVYPVSRFVHVDVREKPYSWRDNSGPDEDGNRHHHEDGMAERRDTSPAAGDPTGTESVPKSATLSASL